MCAIRTGIRGLWLKPEYDRRATIGYKTDQEDRPNVFGGCALLSSGASSGGLNWSRNQEVTKSKGIAKEVPVFK